MTQKKQLVEIKSGETGYGILVESDGYISRDLTENNKQIIKEALESRENGEWNIPNPFILDVILQKYGVENANKRIYPENILKREVEKYQNLIKQRMALGECYKPDTEIFTKSGWKRLDEITIEDEIITLNVHDVNCTYNKPTLKIEKEFNGELITIKSSNNFLENEYGFNDTVTPGHKFPVFDLIDGKFIFREFIESVNLKDSIGYIPISITPNANENNKETDYININELEFGVEKYNGKVMCVEVPNHTIYVKCNGKSHWSGNCNHPSASEIDLGRISHNIIECHWEGHTLVGKIEFNVTEGFRRYGICSSLGDTVVNLIMNGYKIGVSSRGIGSVKTQLGKTIVCDDFELICWDVVATPSTPGSYIGDIVDLKQYVESDETKKEKNKLNEKIEKIKGLL